MVMAFRVKENTRRAWTMKLERKVEIQAQMIFTSAIVNID